MKQTTESLKVFVIILPRERQALPELCFWDEIRQYSRLPFMLTYSECVHPLYVLKYSCHHHLGTAALPITF